MEYEEGWLVYEWDDVNGEDGFIWKKSEEELRQTIENCKVFCYAVHIETKEIIKNDKPVQPDWIYMREQWGMELPGIAI